jgi:hypothetical protein
VPVSRLDQSRLREVFGITLPGLAEALAGELGALTVELGSGRRLG